MQHYNKGFALVTVLIFLMCFSLLSIALLEELHFTIKNTTNYARRNELTYFAERQLQLIEKDLLRVVPPCGNPIKDAGNLAKMRLEEWKKISCAGNFKKFQYYYFVENLGLNACRQIGMGIADYFRISLLLLQNKNEKIILQSIIAKPSFEKLPCSNSLTLINAGRQSWRLIK